MLAFAASLVLFVLVAISVPKSLRRSEEELRRRLTEGERRVGPIMRVQRAPVAGLVLSFLFALLALLVLLLDHTDSAVLVAVIGVTVGVSVIWAAATLSAIVIGRPAALVHPKLRRAAK